MWKSFGVMMLVMALGSAARAQVVDPTTGFTVDAASDPVDFTAVVSGQPGNAGMEAMMSAQASAQASMDAANASASASIQSVNDSSNVGPVVRAAPRTPKPVMTPNGGTFKGAVQVTIADSDAKAVVFYTTDGKKPTTSSTRYGGPIAVSTKTKVQALAFDVSEMPSAVVSKTFKVKS
jgi:hypothetical protein